MRSAHRVTFPAVCVCVALVLAAWACGDSDHVRATPSPSVIAPPSVTASPSATPSPSPLPLVAVFAAFPAELAALLEHTEVDHTVELNGLKFRVGTLSGVPVVVGMTGIGIVNATATSRAVLDAFAFDAALFSGVAGSTLRIGDVVVPVRWELRDGSGVDADATLLDLARTVESRNDLAFDRCTLMPMHPTEEVCVPHDPVLMVGGIGHTDDPFNGMRLACSPGAGDIFGCDPDEPTPTPSVGATSAGVDTEEPIAQDEETAAVAREAAARGIPFIGFRGVSDGAGDPLNLPPNSFQQFFIYYRLAAKNAALAVAAFFDELRRVP